MDSDAVVLRHSTNGYEVELEDMVNSANVLDSVLRFRTAKQACASDVGSLVHASDEIFDLHLNICNGGIDHRINAREHLLAVLPD